jgi:hypothetical protein
MLRIFLKLWENSCLIILSIQIQKLGNFRVWQKGGARARVKGFTTFEARKGFRRFCLLLLCDLCASVRDSCVRGIHPIFRPPTIRNSKSSVLVELKKPSSCLVRLPPSPAGNTARPTGVSRSGVRYRPTKISAFGSPRDGLFPTQNPSHPPKSDRDPKIVGLLVGTNPSCEGEETRGSSGGGGAGVAG